MPDNLPGVNLPFSGQLPADLDKLTPHERAAAKLRYAENILAQLEKEGSPEALQALETWKAALSSKPAPSAGALASLEAWKSQAGAINSLDKRDVSRKIAAILLDVSAFQQKVTASILGILE